MGFGSSSMEQCAVGIVEIATDVRTVEQFSRQLKTAMLYAFLCSYYTHQRSHHTVSESEPN